MVLVPLFVSLVAVIVAVPAATAVTTPDDDTVATAVLFEPHVTTRSVTTVPTLSLTVAESATVCVVSRDFVGGATVTLPTCDFLPGMVESSAILAQQAAEAGLHINVDVRSAATYFTPAGGFLTRPFGCQAGQPAGSLLTAYRSGYTPHAPYPDTHWGSQPGGAAAQRLIAQAIAATDPAQAAALWRRCQQQQFDEGGCLVWGNLPYVDAAANNVRGLTAGAGFSFNNWRLQDGWLD